MCAGYTEESLQRGVVILLCVKYVYSVVGFGSTQEKRDWMGNGVESDQAILASELLHTS